MSDVTAMAVSDGLKDLLGYVGCFTLSKDAASGDFFEKFTAVAQLSHKEDACLVLVDFVESHNVGMIQVLKDIDLVLKTNTFRIIKSKLVNDFDCSLFIV